MPTLLVIEDGNEYSEFASTFLSRAFHILSVHNGQEALAVLSRQTISAFLIDLRFDRVPLSDLMGNAKECADRLFAGDMQRAFRYLQDQQGILILAAIRQHRHPQPAVFIHDFPERRLQNLQKLYGAVFAVSSFDAKNILDILSKNTP